MIRIILYCMIFVPFFPILVFAECTKPKVPPFDPVTYYESTRGLKGEPLRRALHHIIRGHQRFSSKCVKEILKETDEDPTDPDKVWLLYLEKSVPKIRRDRDEKPEPSWDGERVWDEQHGFPNPDQHAHTDVHHIRPVDPKINKSRGNKEFDDGGSPHSECSTCRSKGDSWEPADSVKGDVARMLFYMDVRYEGKNDGGTPDLHLENRITRKSGGQDSNFGKLCTLIRWHIGEPVSDWERRRNDRIYEWQGNRNPFIDHPEFVLAIWGTLCPAAQRGTDTVLTKAQLLKRFQQLELDVQELKRLIETMKE